MLCGGITQSLLPPPPIPLCLGFGVQDRDVGMKRHVDEGREDIQVTGEGPDAGSPFYERETL